MSFPEDCEVCEQPIENVLTTQEDSASKKIKVLKERRSIVHTGLNEIDLDFYV
jgi:ribosomal protein L7/L12